MRVFKKVIVCVSRGFGIIMFEQHLCVPTDDWLCEFWYIHTMGYHSVISHQNYIALIISQTLCREGKQACGQFCMQWMQTPFSARMWLLLRLRLDVFASCARFSSCLSSKFKSLSHSIINVCF